MPLLSEASHGVAGSGVGGRRGGRIRHQQQTGVAGSGVGSRRGGRIRRQHLFPRRIRVDSGNGTAAA
uniref:Uncharacterized protein n=2 Tax=Oryza TaxID=4527 RepID=A0A0E0P8M9_ORYRU